MEDSSFVRHVPCPKCNSNDNGSEYSDGHVYCHVCGYYAHPDGTERGATSRVSGPLLEVEYTDLTKRGIREETARKYNYGTSTYKGEPVQVYTLNGGKTQKLRTASKDFKFLGENTEELFGQHLLRDGGKMVVITEGEIDAMSVSQVQDNKWPAVSVTKGSKGAKKQLQANLEWLERFESIVLLLDNDEHGQDAVEECAPLFTPGKCRVGTLPLKDANEMLKAGRGSEIVKAIWDAKPYRPDGIVAGTELWDAMMAAPASDHVEYPYPDWNAKLLGHRRGEIVTYCAGTGVGKSEIVGQIAHHFLTKHNETLGYIALEESTVETGFRLVGIEMGKRLLLDREGVAEADMRAAYDRTVGSGRFFLYDHFGSTDSENLFAKIRYMVKGLGCTTLVLDHISIVVSGIGDGDERRIIDNLMTTLASIVKETNVRLLLISHLKKPDGTPFEEGGQITLDHLRGSASIKQLSWDIIALERDQQDEKKKNFTHCRSLKCRRTGRTGSMGWLKYDDESGLLSPTSAPEDDVFEDETKPKNSDF